MRMIVIKQDTDAQGVMRRLLSAGLGAARPEEALRSLQALNPHVDFSRLRTGTVLLVPESPDFERSASEPVHEEALERFEDLLRGGLRAISANVKTGLAARQAEREEVMRVLKTPEFGRLMDADRELTAQVAAVTDGMKRAEEQERQAAESVGDAASGALAELEAVRKVLG